MVNSAWDAVAVLDGFATGSERDASQGEASDSKRPRRLAQQGESRSLLFFALNDIQL